MNRPDVNEYHNLIEYCRDLGQYCTTLESKLASHDAEIKGWRIGMQADVQIQIDMQDEIDGLLAKLAGYESQHPVAYMWIGRKGWKEYCEIPHDTYQCTPLYKAPGAKTIDASLWALAQRADNGGQP